ncbi:MULTISPECIES: hypothetical protein [Catenuloplanes]|uniref:Uncharacterized protein n=1 Tax=Catenuloplanes niger TaxID=587534 RepID=A0AAE3ZVH7_9ACTN|nr:hypothetical protein [Catenuloplanes niger]MDR7325727.1 hypothetical protein [Catenuloplanes niger]
MSPRRPPATPASSPEAGGFLTRRRVVRWAILLTLGVLGFLACWQDPVYSGTGGLGAGPAAVATPEPHLCPTAPAGGGDAAVPGAVVCAAPPAPAVRMADVEVPATGHASVTALLIGTAVVALLFTAITLATLRRRP